MRIRYSSDRVLFRDVTWQLGGRERVGLSVGDIKPLLGRVPKGGHGGRMNEEQMKVVDQA
jgi:hypothetical protein